MNTLKLNSAGLNRVTLNTIGEVRFKSRGGEPKPPSYENGVYIQHIDGKLYTTEEWTANAFANDDANGVAVIAKECKFVMSLSVGASGQSWYPVSEVVDGVLVTDDVEEALTDFNGRENTEKILAVTKYGAAVKANAFTFKNGAKGYLGAAGEWQKVIENKEKIDAIYKAFGKTSVFVYNAVWTSTQNSSTYAWYFYGPAPIISKTYKGDSSAVFPFTELVLPK